MLRATLFIVVCSARNRMRRRLRRLKEPRYIIGAVVGAAYLFVTLVLRRRAFDVRRGTRLSTQAGAAAAAAFWGVAPPLASALLAVTAVASWLFPVGSTLLDFTRAETVFLFPAPATRRQLVGYRLVRSQLSSVIGALIVAVAYPTGSILTRLQGLIGVWLLLMTSHAYFTGVTLARARLLRGGGSRLFVWPALALPMLTVGGVVFSLLTAVPRMETAGGVLDGIRRVAVHEPVRSLLWPFSLPVGPLLARSGGEFLRALAGALVAYVATVAWLLWADAESPDAADAAAHGRLDQASDRTTPSATARLTPWRLASEGAPAWALAWKSAVQTTRSVDRRVFWGALLVFTWIAAASLFVTRARGLVDLAGLGATWGGAFALLMLPQMIRADLRQDLAHLDLLKTWPLSGATLIRGQILWPIASVTAIAWALALLSMLLSTTVASLLPATGRPAVWLTIFIVIPAVVTAQYTVHNAIAVLFPGWIAIGPSRPRGVDAVGQRLVLLAANWICLVAALLPGALVTSGLWFALGSRAGFWILPVGALVAVALVAGEVWLATAALGHAYERMDLTSVDLPD
jgi:hypothetical protein